MEKKKGLVTSHAEPKKPTETAADLYFLLITSRTAKRTGRVRKKGGGRGKSRGGTFYRRDARKRGIVRGRASRRGLKGRGLSKSALSGKRGQESLIAEGGDSHEG